MAWERIFTNAALLFNFFHSRILSSRTLNLLHVYARAQSGSTFCFSNGVLYAGRVCNCARNAYMLRNLLVFILCSYVKCHFLCQFFWDHKLIKRSAYSFVDVNDLRYIKYSTHQYTIISTKLKYPFLQKSDNNYLSRL